jgi:hypothetical protein
MANSLERLALLCGNFSICAEETEIEQSIKFSPDKSASWTQSESVGFN